MISIGIDIGASFIKTAVINSGGKILHQKNCAHFSKTPSALIKKTAQLINTLKTFYKNQKITVGVGIAGIVDAKSGVIKYSPNLHKWKDVNFLKPLKKLTGLRLLVDNDANMSAWGAYEYELNRKYTDIFMVTLGTGIGGGIVLGGKLYRGASLSAGEIGHTKISLPSNVQGGLPNYLVCACGAKGCLETYAGAYGTLNLARKAIASFKGKTKLTKKDLSAENLNIAAQRKDAFALKIWQTMGFYLGRGLANMVLLLNPEVIVIAGGLSKAHRFFMPEIKKVFAEQKIKHPFKNLKIKIAKTENLGAIGAALYAKHHIK